MKLSITDNGEMRTYTIHDITIQTAHDTEIRSSRAVSATVGTQALEPGVNNGKTLLRLEIWKSGLLESQPQMRVRLGFKDKSKPVASLEDVNSIELLFDNTSFLSPYKEMPFWLIEALEFAAKKLREQYQLNQDGALRVENLE